MIGNNHDFVFTVIMSWCNNVIITTGITYTMICNNQLGDSASWGLSLLLHAEAPQFYFPLVQPGTEALEGVREQGPVLLRLVLNGAVSHRLLSRFRRQLCRVCAGQETALGLTVRGLQNAPTLACSLWLQGANNLCYPTCRAASGYVLI